MAAPKFKEGEVVILQSKSRPEMNGEYTIMQVVQKGDKYTCRMTGTPCGRVMGTVSYRLEEVYPTEVCRNHPYIGLEIEICWSESALRKKHEGGMDFQSLIQSLKTPIKEGV